MESHLPCVCELEKIEAAESVKRDAVAKMSNHQMLEDLRSSRPWGQGLAAQPSILFVTDLCSLFHPGSDVYEDARYKRTRDAAGGVDDSIDDGPGIYTVLNILLVSSAAVFVVVAYGCCIWLLLVFFLLCLNFFFRVSNGSADGFPRLIHSQACCTAPKTSAPSSLSTI